MKKYFDKIIKHTFDIIFGILAGSGLMFLIDGAFKFTSKIISISQPYFTILYVVLYLFVLIPTSTLYTKGWFKKIYLTSALILLFTDIYTRIWGAII